MLAKFLSPVATSPTSFVTDVYHGSGCECVWLGNPLPTWLVLAKRLDVTRAAVLAINVANVSLPHGSISVPIQQIFGTNNNDTNFEHVEKINELNIFVDLDKHLINRSQDLANQIR